MTTAATRASEGLSRRAFLGLGAGIGASALLAACGKAGGPGGGNGQLSFWDPPWGDTTYEGKIRALVSTYKSPDGKPVKYQSIPWLNWFQTFTSAIQSHTGPSVSTGGSFMQYQFYVDGAIHPADGLLATLQKSGVAADYVPGTVDALRYNGKLLAVPQTIDARMLWYRSDLLTKANVAPPATWDDFRSVSAALKKIGVYGFGLAGNRQDSGYQSILPWIINNGGGLFNADGEPDCVTDRNIETVEFLQSLVKDGYISANNVSYTFTQVRADVRAGRQAMLFSGANEDSLTFKGPELKLASPMTGPHGDKGCLRWVQPTIMYNSSASVADTEAFTEWWASAIKTPFADGTFSVLPARTSFQELPFFKNSASSTKALREWIPIGKSVGALSPQSFPLLNSVEGATPTAIFTQQVVQAQDSPQKILQTLQDGYEALSKK